MPQRWIGPTIATLIVVGVAAILLMNLNPGGPSPTHSAAKPSPSAPGARPDWFREYPIGDDVERNQMQIAAVYLPAVAMDGSIPAAGSDLIHLEADIAAAADNPNGFPKDGFIPYLRVDYRIEPAEGGPPRASGALVPMVAQDGLHYGANLSMPAAGRFRLTYTIRPPVELGRHSDPYTGVAPWWEPFEVSFDWDYPGPPGAEPGALTDASRR